MVSVEFARKSPGQSVVWSTVLHVNEVLPQLDELLSSAEDVSVESLEVTDTVVRIEARTTAKRAVRPGCGCWSRRIHGHTLRFPRDLPTADKFVVLSLRVRRSSARRAPARA